MRWILFPCLVLFAACNFQEAETTKLASTAEPLQPNFLLILADDLGFSDLGAYGGEIATPNLDALANEGVQMLNFHSAPTCSPTRGMLLTGIDSHRVGLASNAAALQRRPELQGRLGYEGYLNQHVVALPERLAALGYQSFMVGKWDLGAVDAARPANRGFDESFALMESGASHFNLDGNFSNQQKVRYYDNDVLVETLPDDFYSSQFFTEKLAGYIEEAGTDQPWLAYAAYTAPHWPLQVPEDTKLPAGYEAGWTEVARQRLARQIELGLFGTDTEILDRSREWESLNEEQRRNEVRLMQVYAAMIEILDEQIGILIDRARAASSDRPLVVLFMSDNGPEGNNVGLILDTQAYIEERFDLSYENLGFPDSYAWTGQRWAEVSATPLSLFKSFVSEGGMRVPAIISVPGLQGRTSQPASVIDIVPTLVHLAGGDVTAQPEFGSKLPVQGVNLLPALESPGQMLDRPALGFELYGNRALISGRYKASLIWPPAGTGQWELYDLTVDPQEQHNLAQEMPELMQVLEEQWWEYAEENGVLITERDSGYGRYEEY